MPIFIKLADNKPFGCSEVVLCEYSLYRYIFERMAVA